MAARGPQGIDGVTRYLGFRWEHHNELRLTIEERHINLAGLLSGAVATMRSEVRHEDGLLIATAIGSYTIYPRNRPAQPAEVG